MRTLVLLSSLFISFSSLADGWVPKADHGGDARHRSTMLTLGNCVYFGLGHYNGAGPNILLGDWWQYDPATNAWTQKADYMGGPTYHAAAFAIDDIGYVGTGRIPGSILVQDFYSYDPTTNSWTQLQNFPGSARRGGVGFAIDGYGYIGTGTYTSDFFRYDPALDQWTSVAPMPTVGRISAVGFELGGYGYVGTGNASGASTDFWRYDPALNQWTQMANVGPTPRQEACGFTARGKGYILTGDNFSSGTNYGDMWEYDPATNTWTQFEDFPGIARRYMVATSFGDHAYAGSGTNGTNFKDFWYFDPLLSVLEKNLENIKINAYPNPSTDFVNFSFEGLEAVNLKDIQLTLTSLTGKVVYDQPLGNETVTVETSNLASGNYLYSISYATKTLKSGQLTVK